MKKLIASLALVAVAITLINAADPPAKLSKAQNWHVRRMVGGAMIATWFITTNTM